VFAPKYRRKEVYGKIKADIGQILRKLCEQKGVEIVQAEACSDHIHMLVCIPPSLSGAQFMGYLKGKSSLMIFDRYANLTALSLQFLGNPYLSGLQDIFKHVSNSNIFTTFDKSHFLLIFSRK